MRNPKGFTLVELCVVLGVIAILSVVTIMYGRTWVRQYQLSNLLHSAQGAVRTARMQAISQGRLTTVVITDRLVDSNAVTDMTSSAYLTTYPLYSGDYVTLGPWPNRFDYSSDTPSPNDWGRLVFFVYNSRFYEITDVSSEPMTTSGDYVGLQFRSRGFPADYKARAVSLRSKLIKKVLNFSVTQTGKIE